MSIFPQTKAWVLGPKAENADIFEKLLLEAFRDYCYWRRNFHPEDMPYIKAEDRLDSRFQRYLEDLQDHLFEMLSHLKRSVPFFSPRYLGHMNTDLLMPGLLGYMASMLYNQNNIIQESATITQKFESEAMRIIARMLHLPEQSSWGHLCSGGTVANIESLWVARDLRLVPYQMALATLRHQAEILAAIETRSGDLGSLIKERRLRSLSLEEIIELQNEVSIACKANTELASVVDQYSVGRLGLAHFMALCRESFGDDCPRSYRVLLSSNAHYSLKKGVSLLGLGEDSLIKIPLDRHLRLNVAELEKQISQCHANNESVLAVVGVYGSTEEGALDDFDKIIALRDKCRQEEKRDFWVHADACYGGYALSLSHSGGIVDQTIESLMQRIMQETGWCETADGHVGIDVSWTTAKCAEWLRRSSAIGLCDSIAIDPHKLGYIPYPAGAVLYKDGRVREVIKCEAPYLNAAENEMSAHSSVWDEPYLGKVTLEGSRPGAYSAAVWLAHKTVPLTRDGHGVMVAESILGARYLQRILEEELSEDKGSSVRCQFLCEDPDLNILCYTFPTILNIGTEEERRAPLWVLNQGVERLYAELLTSELQPTHTRDFVIAKTSLDEAEYRKLLEERYLPRLREAGLDEKSALVSKDRIGIDGNPWRDDHQIALARTVVMGPFLLQAKTRPTVQSGSEDLVRRFAQAIKEKFERIVRDIMNEPIPQSRRPMLRGNVLILEDDMRTCTDLERSLKGSFIEQEGIGQVYIPPKKDREAISSRAISDTLKGKYNVALVDIELDGDAIGGKTFLEAVIGKDTFKGAVVFTSHPEYRDEIQELSKRHKKLIKFHTKPSPMDEQYQAAVNLIMEDLWNILR